MKSTRRRLGIFVLAVLPWLFSASVPSEDDPTEPLDIGQVEEVEVQLVLLDVLVMDRRDRTVPGLSAEEFQLRVNSNEVEIDSLDVNCPLGQAADPRAGQRPGVPERSRDSGPVRRIVHAFDYYHIGVASETIDFVLDAVRRLAGGNEEHMIVSIGPTVRVELPFTTDIDAVTTTLERMYADPSLYAGFYGRLTEHRVYRMYAALVDFLELIDGHKVVLLYSGPFRPDGFTHDQGFQRLASLTAKARVSFYPVDSRGLTAPRRFVYGDFGGPKELARLAVESGGRLTFNTNDLGLALARAQRDLGCRYTIGFYDRDPIPDRPRRVSVTIDKKGVRAVYPVYYVLRSNRRKLASQVRTAVMVPEMYRSGGMQAEVVPLRPRSTHRWDVLLAVSLPEIVDSAVSDRAWELVGVVSTPSGAAIRKFRREFIAPPPETQARTVVESVTLMPGRYRLSAVLSRPGMQAPLATQFSIEVPEIPRDELFLVGPHLGWYTSIDPPQAATSTRRGSPEATRSFEPLLTRSTARGKAIDALTWICRVGKEPAVMDTTVERELTSSTGRTVGSFDPVQVTLDEEQQVSCRALVDTVPTVDLEPGRYAVRVYVPGLPGPVQARELAFAITP